MAADSQYFHGAVTVSALPLLQAPTPPGAPPLKRLQLPQGELAQIHDSDEGLRYAALIELVPGTVRGNHYHKVKRERVYVVRGSLELKLQEIATGATQNVHLPAGSMVFIEPGIAHALHTRDAGFAMEFSVDRYDPSDTYRHTVA